MPSFSVVSVVPSRPDEMASQTSTNADSYHAERTTIQEVLAYAFGIGYDGEMIKPPAWVSHDRFDITGKLDDEQIAVFHAMDRDEREAHMRLMVQSLLQERFHLVYHFETRELPVFRLGIAKSGFKCPRDTTSPPAITDPSRPRFRPSAAPPPPPPPPGWQPPSPQELRRLQQSMHLHTKGWPFWLFVTVLSHQPELEGKPVLDDTGLDGAFECDLMWSREGTEGTGQDFFPAVRDQLGLKFELSRGRIEVLVVDSIDQPSAN
jgi:uncharacterized protein (TIGR03435 family)